MDAGEHYALSELRQMIAGPLHHHHHHHHNHIYEMLQLGGDGREQIEEVVLSPPSNAAVESPPLQPPPPCLLNGLRDEGDGGFGGNGFGVCSQGRWPRQETLTLLEIRSRLDFKFKEATEKAPLWEEVSRIMAEEHGYQRSGKKCREKLENLYKYYKKTKEGKAGRHDGKHYRFFRQLEALYGDGSSNPMADSANIADYPNIFHAIVGQQEPIQQPNKQPDNLYLSNSSGSDSWSSEEIAQGAKRGRRKKGWRAKMKEFVDQQLERFMAIQEAWLERMLSTLEAKEKERMTREEERRKREAASLAEEQRFWARERAWMEARDAALIEALERLSGWTPPADDDDDGRWPDSQVTRLIQIRTAMEERFQGDFCKSSLWEEISVMMGSSGYSCSARQCREKWENVNKCFRKSRKNSKKRKESYGGEGSEEAVAIEDANEERYVPFLVDGSSSLWEGSILQGQR